MAFSTAFRVFAGKPPRFDPRFILFQAWSPLRVCPGTGHHGADGRCTTAAERPGNPSEVSSPLAACQERPGLPPLAGGWRIFRIRPGRRQGVSPSWRLVGPSWPRPCFRPQPPAGFPFRALLRRPSNRPFRTSSFPALSSPKATLANETQGRLAPQSLTPARQLYGPGGCYTAARRNALLGFGPLRYSPFPPCARGGGPSSWLLQSARTEARAPPAVESIGSGKMSWTLASLLTPLVFLASFVRPNHSATGRPGIMGSPQRLRHITAPEDAS